MNDEFKKDDFKSDKNRDDEGKTSNYEDILNNNTDSIKGVDISRMKMVLDVPLKVTVELGRTKLLVNDILQLGQGSVIELDKMAGEPMEIYVNDKLIAMGEVVVVN